MNMYIVGARPSFDPNHPSRHGHGHGNTGMRSDDMMMQRFKKVGVGICCSVG